ncbi:helix-turn-helix domain-containing protein [Agrobacterium sp. ES01]|uniref:helix-turn-helix domain-containing protein n=1 Tax=Agrobacterium sp. ES01 TaxID=3420714 RepID=UPI003D0DDECB
MSTIGERFQMALASRGASKQMAFAARIGVDASQISRWRRGRGWTVGNAVRVCLMLDISADWLLLGRGRMDLHVDPMPARSEDKLSEAATRLPPPIIDVLTSVAETVQAQLDHCRH